MSNNTLNHSDLNMNNLHRLILKTTNNINSYEKAIDSNIKNITEFIKDAQQISKHMKKKSKRNFVDNSLMFYNSLSLVMLSMLAGGLVGVVFILYFSFKKEDKHNIV